MTENNSTNNLEYSHIKCPHCQNSLPRRIFKEYLFSHLLRAFIVIYALTFTITTFMVDIRMMYFTTSNLSINPYWTSSVFAGLISLLAWSSQRKKEIIREAQKIE